MIEAEFEDFFRWDAPPSDPEADEPSPYEAGYAACICGIPLSSNPYHRDEDREEWQRGWEAANNEV